MFKSLKLKLCAGLLALIGLVGGGAAISQVKPIETRAATNTVSFSHTQIVGMADAAAESTSGTYGDFTITVDGITSSGFNASESVRVYKGASITIACSTGNMTSVTFTCMANGTTKYGPGSMTGAGYTAGTAKTGTWSGDAASFTLTASANQTRISDFQITYTTSSSEGTSESSSEPSSESSEVPSSEEPGLPTVLAGSKDTYSLVTNVAELQANDQILIVAPDADYVLGSTQGSNNRPGSSVIDVSSFQAITLDASNTNWTFGVDEGYLYAASSSSNWLRTQEENDDNGVWTITVTEDGFATIVAQGSNERNMLLYNPANHLFSCYKAISAQTAYPRIYRHVLTPFVDTYMHMDEYTDDFSYNKTRCDANYSGARTAWAGIDSVSKAFFCNNQGPFANAYERLLAWAHAHGEEIGSNYEISQGARTVFIGPNAQVFSPTLIWVLSTGGIGLATIALLAIVNRKRYN